MNYTFQDTQLPYFSEYVYYENIFTPDEIAKVLDYWNDQESSQARVSNENPYDLEFRKSKVQFLPNTTEYNWIYQKLGMLIQQCNGYYYGFDLKGIREELQLAKYDTGDFFDWHMDFGAGEISHRKLSLSIQLSDTLEYEGGDLKIMVQGKEETAPRTKGAVIIFPSFVQHRVTEITKGTRASIVGWFSGNPYR